MGRGVRTTEKNPIAVACTKNPTNGLLMLACDEAELDWGVEVNVTNAGHVRIQGAWPSTAGDPLLTTMPLKRVGMIQKGINGNRHICATSKGGCRCHTS